MIDDDGLEPFFLPVEPIEEARKIPPMPTDAELEERELLKAGKRAVRGAPAAGPAAIDPLPTDKDLESDEIAGLGAKALKTAAPAASDNGIEPLPTDADLEAEEIKGEGDKILTTSAPAEDPPEDLTGEDDEPILAPPGSEDENLELDELEDPELPEPGPDEMPGDLLEPDDDLPSEVGDDVLEQQKRARYYDAVGEAREQAEKLAGAAERAAEIMTGASRKTAAGISSLMKALVDQCERAQKKWGDLATDRCATITGTVEERVKMATSVLNDLIDDGPTRE